MIRVEVKSTTGKYTEHSTHQTWSDAIDQCDMVHGRIVVENPTTTLEFVRWSDGESHDSYSCWDYFDGSIYLGADDYGIEPEFEVKTVGG